MSGFSQLNLRVIDSLSLKLGLIGTHLCAATALLLAAIPLMAKLCCVLVCAVFMMHCVHEMFNGCAYTAALDCCPDEG